MKIVHRNIDDAFPLFLPGWKGGVDATVQALHGVSGEVRAQYETQIQGLVYGLSALNESTMFQFRGAYMAYMNDPCSNTEFFNRQISSMLHEQYRMQLLRTQIQGLVALAQMQPNDHEGIRNALVSLLMQVEGPAVAPAAAMEIADSAAIARKWAEGR